MDKTNSVGKWALIGVAVVVVIVAAVIYGGNQGQSPAPETTATSSNSGTSTNAPAPSTPSPAPASGSGSQPVAAPAITINLITPVKNDLWMINKSNPIVWDREAGITGEIDLLDATTKNLIGVILSETGAHQTSYSWDTRQIYLLRYSPLKKDIVAGNYVIRLKFDGNNLSNLVSAPFTITQ